MSVVLFKRNSLYQKIRNLFANGEPGFWLDPSDFSTMFQDSAGTTAVTAVEQPVGLILDKSKGLVLGAELITAAADRDFSSDTGFWAKGPAWTISGGAANVNGVLDSGTGTSLRRLSFLTVGKVYQVTFTVKNFVSGTVGIFAQGATASYAANGTYTFIFCCTNTVFGFNYGGITNGSSNLSIDDVSIKEVLGTHYYQSTAGVRPVLSARVNLLLATATLSTQSVTVTAGSYVLAFSGAGSVALSGVSSGTKTAGSNTITCTAGTLTLTVTGSVTLADLRPADQATGLIPAYQAVVTSTNYDTAGFPLYLSGNGTQWMQCAAQDYTGVGKMLVCGGVRSINTADGISLEIGNIAVTNGSLLFGYWFSSLWYFGARNVSTSQRYASTYPQPITSVLSCAYDLAAATTPTQIAPRVNTATPTLTDIGGATTPGTFGNVPGYLFCRGGTAAFLTGNIYGLVGRGSTAASSAAQIAAVEAYENQKTRAF